MHLHPRHPAHLHQQDTCFDFLECLHQHDDDLFKNISAAIGKFLNAPDPLFPYLLSSGFKCIAATGKKMPFVAENRLYVSSCPNEYLL
jgi:hypothetical protein